MAALDHLRHVVFHVVAQIVEAEFVVRAIGDVGGIGRAALFVIESVNDDAYAQAEETVDLPHPFRVAAGEIIVDGDDMHALGRERVEINGERGDQGLAFAGLHLGDLAFVQDHAADQLHVEVALADGPLGGLTHGGEGRDQDIVERGALGELLLEVGGARLQGLVGQRRHLGFQRVDGGDPRLIAANPPFIGRTEQLAGNGADHR